MAFQSFIIYSLLFLQSYVGASSLRLSHRHQHSSAFSKRSNLKSNKGSCIGPTSNSNGAKVVVGSCSANWVFPSSGSGQIHVNGKCLDVTDGANQDGTKLQIWDCTGGPNQKFVLSNGEIQWKGTNKCLDLTNGSTSNGNPIQIWECFKGNTNQQWEGLPSSNAPSSGGGSGGSNKNIFPHKIGLAYGGSPSELDSVSKVSRLIYNWGPKDDGLGGNGNVFAPMLWGWDQQQEFDEIAKTSDAPLFLFINEPNESGQSNMSPGSAVSLWKQSFASLKGRGKKTCGPVTSGNPNGLTWVADFVKQCPECDFDYVCVHWYDTTFAKFEKWLNQWHDMFPNKQILVTEFAPQNFNSGGQPSVSEVWAFYQQAIPFCINTPWIANCMPYGVMDDLNINGNARLLQNGQLTSLGHWIFSQG